MSRPAWTRADASATFLYFGAVVAASSAIALLPSMHAAQDAVVTAASSAEREARVIRLYRSDGFDDARLADIQRTATRWSSPEDGGHAIVCPAPERAARLRHGDTEVAVTLVGVDVAGDPRLGGGFDRERVSLLAGQSFLAPDHVPGWGRPEPGERVTVGIGPDTLTLPVSSRTLPASVTAGRSGAVIALDFETMRRRFGVDPIDRVDVVVPHRAATGRDLVRELVRLDPKMRDLSVPNRLDAATWHRAWRFAGSLAVATAFLVAVWVLILATRTFLRRPRGATPPPVLTAVGLALLGFATGVLHATIIGVVALGVFLPRWIGDAVAIPVSAIGVSAPVGWAFAGGVLIPSLWEALARGRLASESRWGVVPEAPTALAGIALFLGGILMQPTFGAAAPYLAVAAFFLIVMALGLLARPGLFMAARALHRMRRVREHLTARILVLQLVDPHARLGLAITLLAGTAAALALSWTLASEIHLRERAWFHATVPTGLPADVLAWTIGARALPWRGTLVAMLPLWLLALGAAAAVGPSCLFDPPPAARALVAWGGSRRRLARATLEGQILAVGVALFGGGVIGVAMAHVMLAALNVPAARPAPLTFGLPLVALGLWALAAISLAVPIRWRSITGRFSEPVGSS